MPATNHILGLNGIFLGALTTDIGDLLCAWHRFLRVERIDTWGTREGHDGWCHDGWGSESVAHFCVFFVVVASVVERQCTFGRWRSFCFFFLFFCFFDFNQKLECLNAGKSKFRRQEFSFSPIKCDHNKTSQNLFKQSTLQQWSININKKNNTMFMRWTILPKSMISSTTPSNISRSTIWWMPHSFLNRGTKWFDVAVRFGPFRLTLSVGLVPVKKLPFFITPKFPPKIFGRTTTKIMMKCRFVRQQSTIMDTFTGNIFVRF